MFLDVIAEIRWPLIVGLFWFFGCREVDNGTYEVTSALKKCSKTSGSLYEKIKLYFRNTKAPTALNNERNFDAFLNAYHLAESLPTPVTLGWEAEGRGREIFSSYTLPLDAPHRQAWDQTTDDNRKYALLLSQPYGGDWSRLVKIEGQGFDFLKSRLAVELPDRIKDQSNPLLWSWEIGDDAPQMLFSVLLERVELVYRRLNIESLHGHIVLDIPANRLEAMADRLAPLVIYFDALMAADAYRDNPAQVFKFALGPHTQTPSELRDDIKTRRVDSESHKRHFVGLRTEIYGPSEFARGVRLGIEVRGAESIEQTVAAMVLIVWALENPAHTFTLPWVRSMPTSLDLLSRTLYNTPAACEAMTQEQISALQVAAQAAASTLGYQPPELPKRWCHPGLLMDVWPGFAPSQSAAMRSARKKYIQQLDALIRRSNSVDDDFIRRLNGYLGEWAGAVP